MWQLLGELHTDYSQLVSTYNRGTVDKVQRQSTKYEMREYLDSSIPVMLLIVQAGQALSLSASHSNEEMQEYFDSLLLSQSLFCSKLSKLAMLCPWVQAIQMKSCKNI